MATQEAIERISINGVDYVRADIIPDTNGDIKIIVADRGFVYIGRCEEIDGFIRLTSAKNIRVWGTTKGLGELVYGPLESTRLDNVGIIRIPDRAVISIIDVDQGAWKTL